MRKHSFFSQTRKPLLLASLMVSLTLHAGGFYFLFKHPFSFVNSGAAESNSQTVIKEIKADLDIDFALTEILSHLIIKEETNETLPFDCPCLETTDQKLNIITNFSYAPKIALSSKSFPFHMEDSIHPKIERKTHAPFTSTAPRKKTGSTFNQQLKIDQVSLSVINETTVSNDPIINQKQPFLEPSLEIRQKELFDSETFYFFYNENFKDFSSSLDTTHLLIPTLHKKPFAPPKNLIGQKKQLSNHFFSSITPFDLSSLSEESDLSFIQPQNEIIATTAYPLSIKNSYVQPLPDLPSLEIRFADSQSDLPSESLKNHFKRPIFHRTYSLGSTFPKNLPDLPEKFDAYFVKSDSFPFEKQPVQCSTFFEELSWKHSNTLTLIPATAFFDFLIESSTFSVPKWAPPKQKLTSVPSSLSLIEQPYLMQQTSAAALTVKETIIPKQEQIEAVSHLDIHHTLAHQQISASDEVHSSFIFPSEEITNDHLISQKIHFPKTPLYTHQLNSKQIELPNFHPYSETEMAKRQTPPEEEKIKQLEYESSLALDLDDVYSNKQELYLPQELDALPLSPAQTPLPKQKLSKLLSPLPMKRQVSPIKDPYYENNAFSQSFEPKKESFVITLDSKLINELAQPPIPRYLMKRLFEKSIQLKLNESLINLNSQSNLPHNLSFLHINKTTLFPKHLEEQTFLKSLPLAHAIEQKTMVQQKKEVTIPNIPEHEQRKPNLLELTTSKKPSFHFDKNELIIEEKELSLLKKEMDLQDPLPLSYLPYLSEKKVLSDIIAWSSKQASAELLNIDKSLDLLPKQASYSNIQPFLSKSPLPQEEFSKKHQKELSLVKELKAPNITNIYSEGKTLVENHYEKSLVQNKTVEISTPQLKKHLTEKDFHILNETHRFTQNYLSEIPSITHLDTLSFNNDFETVVSYVPKSNGQGYHFALKIKPAEKLYVASSEKNFVFIVDGSSTIKKHRYNAFKEAIVRSLPYMHDGDSFNILVADSQIMTMSDKPLIWNKEIISKVRNYLQTRSYRGYFSKYDAFYLLSQATKYLDPHKENIVIFMTDGHSLDGLNKHKESLKTLVKESKGHFSLFTACASQDNNITMLDLISTFNHGELMYSQTNAAFPRKLAVLVRHIETCIAKDICIHVTSPSHDLDIQFYPNQESYPALYGDHPYILYGSIDKLEDFDIILQGRAGDQWINIKQHVSFQNGEVGGYQLKRNFAMQQAYVCYDYYLQKNDPFFLAEAERLLTPHAIMPATQ